MNIKLILASVIVVGILGSFTVASWLNLDSEQIFIPDKVQEREKVQENQEVQVVKHVEPLVLNTGKVVQIRKDYFSVLTEDKLLKIRNTGKTRYLAAPNYQGEILRFDDVQLNNFVSVLGTPSDEASNIIDGKSVVVIG